MTHPLTIAQLECSVDASRGTPLVARDIWALWDHLGRCGTDCPPFSGVRFSALALFRNFQPLLGGQFRQSLLCAPRSQQRDFLRSEPLLGDAHQLLERIIAGIAK